MCHSLRSLSTAVHLSTAQDAIKNAASLRGPLVDGWYQQKLSFGVLGYAGFLGCWTYTWIDFTIDLGLISQRMRVISPCLWSIFPPQLHLRRWSSHVLGMTPETAGGMTTSPLFSLSSFGPRNAVAQMKLGMEFWPGGTKKIQLQSFNLSLLPVFTMFFLISIPIFLRFPISNQHPHFWRIPPFFREYSHSSGPFPHQVAIHLTPNSPRKTTTFTTIAWNQI